MSANYIRSGSWHFFPSLPRTDINRRESSWNLVYFLPAVIGVFQVFPDLFKTGQCGDDGVFILLVKLVITDLRFYFSLFPFQWFNAGGQGFQFPLFLVAGFPAWCCRRSFPGGFLFFFRICGWFVVYSQEKISRDSINWLMCFLPRQQLVIVSDMILHPPSLRLCLTWY